MVPDSIRKEIVNKIASKKPYKVFLFGSYAYGNVGKESDVVCFHSQQCVEKSLKALIESNGMCF